MKKQFAILLIVVMIFMLFALSGCSDGAKLELPTYADLHSYYSSGEMRMGSPSAVSLSAQRISYYQSHPRMMLYFSTKGYQQNTNVSQRCRRETRSL
jgi:hypothetical protein